MVKYLKEYSEKLKTAREAVQAVKSGDWVDYTMALGIPATLDEALAARVEELSDIKVRSTLTLRPSKIIEADPTGKTFNYMNWHFGSYDRAMYDKGRVYYIPLLYRNMPIHYRNTLEVDVAMVTVAPMDQHGYFNFSLNNSATAAILEKAKIVIVEVNEKMPRVFGIKDECVHISNVDYIVECDDPLLPVLPAAAEKVVQEEERIAEYIIEEIRDGSTIQLGIGGLPNTIGRLLSESDIRDLGMHTEMLVDSYLDLYEAGKLTNKCKQIDKNKGVFTFCIGSARLYEWARENHGLVSAPVDYTNSPEIMAMNDNLVSINNCIEVDLFGQVCAEASGIRQITGTGGQLDFLTGSYMSKGGKGYICMTSTYKDKISGELRSRIVPVLPPGGIVSDPRSQSFYVVTEYGKVNLAGRSVWERAEALISIAHPEFQDELIRKAEKMNIWRRSNKK